MVFHSTPSLGNVKPSWFLFLKAYLYSFKLAYEIIEGNEGNSLRVLAVNDLQREAEMVSCIGLLELSLCALCGYYVGG